MMEPAVGDVVNVVNRVIIPRCVVHTSSDRKFCHVPPDDVFVPRCFPISDSVALLIDQDCPLDCSVYQDVSCIEIKYRILTI